MKKSTVVMLPTKEKSNLVLCSLFGKDKLVFTTKILPIQDEERYQHLYFLSNKEIKEGDWFVIFTNDKPVAISKGIFDKDCKKIIATTDKSVYHIEGGSSIRKFLPQPSQAFLEVFVKEYNKGNVIKEVMVEYDNIQRDVSDIIDTSGTLNGLLLDEYKLKINLKDNTITIKRVKDSWNREEVIELLHLRMKYTLGLDYQRSTTDKWIEQNL